jgi:O-antigen/teichoic acid export membrane protein
MTGHIAGKISARRAVAVGHLVVNLPTLVVVGAVVVVALRYLNDGGALALAMGTFGLAWLWWAFTVPRWRRWAIARGAETAALQRLGQRTGLLWREGTWMSRTEFRLRRP